MMGSFHNMKPEVLISCVLISEERGGSYPISVIIFFHFNCLCTGLLPTWLQVCWNLDPAVHQVSIGIMASIVASYRLESNYCDWVKAIKEHRYPSLIYYNWTLSSDVPYKSGGKFGMYKHTGTGSTVPLTKVFHIHTRSVNKDHKGY